MRVTAAHGPCADGATGLAAGRAIPGGQRERVAGTVAADGRPSMRPLTLLTALILTTGLATAARAQSSPAADSPELVSLQLRADTPALRVELAPEAENSAPPASCVVPCRLLVPPGRYRVRVSGDDQDIEGSARRLSVRGDADVLLRAPSESRKRHGKQAGITGVAIAGGGLLLTTLGVFVTAVSNSLSSSSFGPELDPLEEEDESGSTQDEPYEETWLSPLVPVGLGILTIGGVVATFGWSTTARNHGPRLRVRLAPALR